MARWKGKADPRGPEEGDRLRADEGTVRSARRNRDRATERDCGRGAMRTLGLASPVPVPGRDRRRCRRDRVVRRRRSLSRAPGPARRAGRGREDPGGDLRASRELHAGPEGPPDGGGSQARRLGVAPVTRSCSSTGTRRRRSGSTTRLAPPLPGDGASAIVDLAMIFANGWGVARDYDAATWFLCRLDASDRARREGGDARSRREDAHGRESRKTSSYCDHATSTHGPAVLPAAVHGGGVTGGPDREGEGDARSGGGAGAGWARRQPWTRSRARTARSGPSGVSGAPGIRCSRSRPRPRSGRSRCPSSRASRIRAHPVARRTSLRRLTQS